MTTNASRREKLITDLGLAPLWSGGYAERALRALTWIALLLVPTLMLLIPVGSTEIFALLAATGFVVWLRRKRNDLRRLSREERIMCWACLAFVATVIFSVVEQRAAYEAVSELDTLLRPLLAIPLLYLMIRTRPPASVLWVAMALCALLAGMNAIAAATAAGTGSLMVTGAAGHIAYGRTAIGAGFLALLGIGWFRHFARTYLLLALLALGLGLAAGFLSGSRGAWSTLPALVALLVWHYWQPGFRRWALGGAAVILVASIAAFSIPQTGVKDRIDTAVTEIDRYMESPRQYGGTSVGLRFEMWRGAWDMFKTHPVSGGGMGETFNRFLREGVEANRYHPSTRLVSMPHNAFFQVLATRGLIGFAGLLALLGGLIWIYLGATFDTAARARSLGTAGLMLLALYVFAGMTHSVFDYGRPLMFFVLYGAFLVYLIAETRSEDDMVSGVTQTRTQ